MPATKKRRLTDLYVVGKEVTLNDGQEDEPVVVWMQKLNPVQNEDALRRAAAARAKVLGYIKDRDSDEYKAAANDVADFASREVLVDLAIADEMRIRTARIEAEMSAEDEWSKDEYLQGLVDAWDGTEDAPGLKARAEDEPDDPEVVRVKSEIDRFNNACQVLIDAERDSLRDEWANVPEDDLLDKGVERVLEQRGTSTFIDEYELWQLYYSVREPDDRKKLYFENRLEVAGLEPEVKTALLGHYRLLTVEPTEGKDSAGTPASSPSSEQPEPEATEPSSGPVVARL